MKNPFKNFSPFCLSLFAFSFSGIGLALGSLTEVYDREIPLFEEITWGKSMSEERNEVEADYKRYKRLWRENKSELLEKTKAELKEFRKNN